MQSSWQKSALHIGFWATRWAIAALFSLTPCISHADHQLCPCIWEATEISQVGTTEPVQRAIIVWNGEIEQLILSTDIASLSPSTRENVESIPLPSKPTVSNESIDIFERLIIVGPASAADWKALVPRSPIGKLLGAGEVKQIETAQGLIVALGRLCQMDSSYIAPMSHIVESYRHRGISWFATDKIEVHNDVHSYPPIVYEFASRRMYYPLETSVMGTGRTQIDLLVITPHGLTRFNPTSTPATVISTYEIDTAALASVKADWPRLLGSPTAVVQHIRLEGLLSEMQLDFTAD